MRNYFNLTHDVRGFILDIARYTIDTGATVRGTARQFGCSKSTVFSHLTQGLQEVDMSLYQKVKEVLDYNRETRSIRGGIANKISWERRKHATI